MFTEGVCETGDLILNPNPLQGVCLHLNLTEPEYIAMVQLPPNRLPSASDFSRTAVNKLVKTIDKVRVGDHYYSVAFKEVHCPVSSI